MPHLPPLYWRWIRSEAELYGADGCSGPAMGFHIECCFEHDLGYRLKKDPRHAYLCFRGGAADPWEKARPIDRSEVDKRFRQCHQNRSHLGRYSPMAWYRWLGVRLGGRRAWAEKTDAKAPVLS